ncbi:MAG: response regulator transcription factor [Lachnospiraceae bacterium]|jgi:two-component system response regulator VanR|nr:response regulator transcription factor [Lachnospiraceae bacterium]MEE3461103.1 response regulator transcription factor [Lachnospiraceae bacterium]
MDSILVADDDNDILDLVEIHLMGEGFKVYKAVDGKEALNIFNSNDIDMAILDIMMPGIDGNEVCRQIRRTSSIPIIMLSARNTEFDKVSGLENGADDYVTKPFNTNEFIARVRSLLRRYHKLGGKTEESHDGEINLTNLWMDRDSHKVKAFGKDVDLTPIEFDILYFLASHPGVTYSTDEIFENVWKEKAYQMSNTVMVHIRRLRSKIEIDPSKGRIIQTVWGVGYKVE